MRRLAFVGMIVPFLMTVSAAPAQPGTPASMPGSAPGGPFGVATYGVFGEVAHNGDFSPKTTLRVALASQPTVGIGALAQARGEVTLVDGRLVVSRGQPDASPGDEAMAWLAIGTVVAWHALPVAFDVAPDKVEAFLAGRARAYGIDPDKSFPFKLSSVVAPFAMHVSAAPLDGGQGRPATFAIERKGDAIAGQVVGFYVAPALVGIATRSGERVHAHWVAPDGSATAHLDIWGIRRGSLLMLPRVK